MFMILCKLLYARNSNTSLFTRNTTLRDTYLCMQYSTWNMDMLDDMPARVLAPLRRCTISKPLILPITAVFQMQLEDLWPQRTATIREWPQTCVCTNSFLAGLSRTESVLTPLMRHYWCYCGQIIDIVNYAFQQPLLNYSRPRIEIYQFTYICAKIISVMMYSNKSLLFILFESNAECYKDFSESETFSVWWKDK